jgi:hypothetical protein
MGRAKRARQEARFGRGVGKAEDTIQLLCCKDRRKARGDGCVRRPGLWRGNGSGWLPSDENGRKWLIVAMVIRG